MDSRKTEDIWDLIQSLMFRPFDRSLESAFSPAATPARGLRRTSTGRRTLTTPRKSIMPRTRHTAPRLLAPLLPAEDCSAAALPSSVSEGVPQSRPTSVIQSVADTITTAAVEEAVGKTPASLQDDPNAPPTIDWTDAPQLGTQLLDMQLIGPADIGVLPFCEFCVSATEQCYIHSSFTAADTWVEEILSDMNLAS